MADKNWSQIGDEIEDMVRNALETKDFGQLSQNISRTVGEAMENVGKSVQNAVNKADAKTREAAEKYGLEPVNVVPQPKAGGSFATTAYARFRRPVAVESIAAHAGMDIGGTLIGMHLRRVAVPVRLDIDHIGEAILLCARTRPKFVGGSRAVYDDALL